MKVLNVFAIILAWILSIAMVIMLVAAPLALSALSLLNPENIVELVGEALVGNNKPAAAQPQEAYAFQKLSAETQAAPEEKSAAQNILGGINLDSIQDFVGEDVNEEVLNKVLESDLVGELLDAYVGDVTNAITGKPGQSQFTAEKLVEVVKDNIDEIVEIVEESGVTLTEDQKAEIKNQIQSAVEENAEDIMSAIPAPEELKKSLVGENKELEIAFEILAARNKIKGMIVGAIVLISLLIFGLRYPGFRGMRWLSTNLFTAGGINVVICLVLGTGSAAALGAEAGMNAIGGSPAAGIIRTLLSQLTTGVVIRTVIMFVAAIALLVGYILLKIFVRKKKAANKEEPVVEEIVSEPVPASVEVPVAPEYADVTVEPELVADPAPQAEDAPAAETEEPVAEESAAELAPVENAN